MLRRITKILLFILMPVIAIANTDSLSAQPVDSILVHPSNIFLFEQADSLMLPDSLMSVDDSLLTNAYSSSDSINKAMDILKDFYMRKGIWKEDNASVKDAIGRLLEYIENGPLDPSLNLLRNYPFNISEPDAGQLVTDSVSAGFAGHASDTTLVTDSLSLKKIAPMGGEKKVDPLKLVASDSIMSVRIDSLIAREEKRKSYMAVNDSVKAALDYILNYVKTDTVRIWLSNTEGDSLELLMSAGMQTSQRFWIKNKMRDSVGLWLNALDNDRLLIVMEDGVLINRLRGRKKRNTDISISNYIDPGFRSVKLREIKPDPWEFRGVGQFLISQVFTKNWAKGGESSVSSLLKGDVHLDYKLEKFKYENLFRAKFGIIKHRDERVRKNEDFWEFSTTAGFKAYRQWYYSFGFNLKSQFAPGYNYPDDSTKVSGLFSPGYLYTTAGFEYNPDKTIFLTFSPLTYRSTFVTDTVNINHSKFGIPLNKKLKSELGVLIKLTHTHKFSEDVNIENRLQLFADYQGFKKIDFDWEMNLRIALGPFFTVNLTSHVLYNTDIKFPVLDDSGTEIDRKPKIQFREWLGFGIAYKF